MTNNLERRMYEHRNKKIPGFTAKYNLYKLVYFEQFTEVKDAISNEKKLKGWLRCKKNELMESVNPNWEDIDPSLRSG